MTNKVVKVKEAMHSLAAMKGVGKKYAQKGGVCRRHGAKAKKLCSHEGCTDHAQKGLESRSEQDDIKLLYNGAKLER